MSMHENTMGEKFLCIKILHGVDLEFMERVDELRSKKRGNNEPPLLAHHFDSRCYKQPLNPVI